MLRQRVLHVLPLIQELSWYNRPPHSSRPPPSVCPMAFISVTAQCGRFHMYGIIFTVNDLAFFVYATVTIKYSSTCVNSLFNDPSLV